MHKNKFYDRIENVTRQILSCHKLSSENTGFFVVYMLFCPCQFVTVRHSNRMLFCGQLPIYSNHRHFATESKKTRQSRHDKDIELYLGIILFKFQTGGQWDQIRRTLSGNGIFGITTVRQICDSELYTLIDEKGKKRQRNRIVDSIRMVTLDEGKFYLILENQERVDYSIPVRILDHESIFYSGRMVFRNPKERPIDTGNISGSVLWRRTMGWRPEYD